MSSLLTVGGYGFGLLFLGAWLYLGWTHLTCLWSGKLTAFGAWSARNPPILRAERPAQFWMRWFVLAWPFVLLPLLIAVGLLLQFSEKF